MHIFSRRKGRHGLPGSYSGWSTVARLTTEQPSVPVNLRPAPVSPSPLELTR